MQHKLLFKKYCTPSILFILGVCVGIALLSYGDTILRVKIVEITGVGSKESVQIKKMFSGSSTLSLTQEKIKKMMVAQYPTIEVQSTHILYPNTLIIDVKRETPIAHIITDGGYLAVSKSGTVLFKERSTIIPQPAITFYQIIHHASYQSGQKMGFSALERTLHFISLLSDLGYQTETVAIDSVDMIACKTKGFEVVFSQTRPVEIQAHEVQQIVRQVKVGALRIVRLDLRFDKPVVQLPKK